MTENSGGVLSYWNIKDHDFDKQPQSISEYPLFTDAHIVGELLKGCEPYVFINMIPVDRAPGVIKESIMLRVSWYVKDNKKFGVHTDTSKYHGGWVTDEIAALASLKLGIRLKAGDETRIFKGYSNDPLGTPRSATSPHPQLTIRSKQLMIPSVVRRVDLTELKALRLLGNVDEDQYVSLVRSARLYQDSLWVSESEPALAWVMLISAIEVAANQQALDSSSPSARLAESKPKLAELLINHGGEHLLTEVSEQITHSLGATNKFIKFCLEFMPDEPENRPVDRAQVKWSKTNLKKMLNKLYEYRSNALHGGTPFPEPMCRPPEKLPDDCGIPEKGCTSLAVHTLGASWKADDLPINMNAFHYIVNGILNKWWDSLAELEANKSI